MFVKEFSARRATSLFFKSSTSEVVFYEREIARRYASMIHRNAQSSSGLGARGSLLPLMRRKKRARCIRDVGRAHTDDMFMLLAELFVVRCFVECGFLKHKRKQDNPLRIDLL